ncbi:MAG TPA: hypothetical protein VGB76_16460 [Pyrinomonadaceae bacterium]|jgi:hypothetical protein
MNWLQLTTRALCLFMLLGVVFTLRAATTPHAPPRASASHNARAPQDQLRCTPRRLRRGDTLTLTMPARHGGYLAIVNPRGKYFFLTSDDSGARTFEKNAGVNPSLSATEFGGMQQLQLSTTDTKAIDYEGSQEKRRAETVFRQTGWYKVLISDTSLERDEPSPQGQCRVYYVNKSR